MDSANDQNSFPYPERPSSGGILYNGGSERQMQQSRYAGGGFLDDLEEALDPLSMGAPVTVPEAFYCPPQMVLPSDSNASRSTATESAQLPLFNAPMPTKDETGPVQHTGTESSEQHPLLTAQSKQVSGEGPRKRMSGGSMFDSTALREWEKQHELELERKIEEETKLRESRHAQAKQQLQEFYEKRAKTIEATKKANREKEASGLAKSDSDAHTEYASDSPALWKRVSELASPPNTSGANDTTHKLLATRGAKSDIATSPGSVTSTTKPTSTTATAVPPKKDTTRMQQVLQSLQAPPSSATLA